MQGYLSKIKLDNSLFCFKIKNKLRILEAENSQKFKNNYRF